MATGGDRNAVCRFKATSKPKNSGSILKCGSRGGKIGMKMMMISVHSSGQPKMKMMNCASIMNCTGVISSDSTHFSTSSCPPSKANAAEKMPEPTNNQQTIALVLAVRKDDSLMMI